MSDILTKGAKGEAVRELQTRLAQLGFTVTADGHFGDITHNLVIAVQAIFGYDIDGVAGPATQKLIQKQLELGWNLERARQHGYATNQAQV